MIKRKIIFGEYDTAANGWTLTEWALSPAEQKTNFVERVGGDGSWDLSTALTDGLVRYRDRELVAAFECSEGDRMHRESEIRRMINQLDGSKLEIRLPDDDLRHLVGRVRVQKEYNDLAHARVTVSAVCEPWKYADAETVVTVPALSVRQTIALTNGGRKALVPTLTVSGSGASVLLEYGRAAQAMSAGRYKWPTLVLTPGGHEVKVSGRGVLTISYREAVLE